jgi:predicted amidophosphoribosyltransferase
MQLHHIDGNNSNNSLENLQMLCPNCHSQTENYCGSANEKKHNYCKDCGKEITEKATYCTACLGKHHRKVERPSIEELIDKFKETKSFLALSKIYGVSDKTISKWFITYGYSGKSIELRKEIK